MEAIIVGWSIDLEPLFGILSLLFWNLCSLVIVTYRSITASKDLKSIPKDKPNCSFWPCVRLTTVLVIGYICQWIGLLTHCVILSIIGDFVNYSQGLCMAICIIWSRLFRKTIVSTSAIQQWTHNPNQRLN